MDVLTTCPFFFMGGVGCECAYNEYLWVYTRSRVEEETKSICGCRACIGYKDEGLMRNEF